MEEENKKNSKTKEDVFETEIKSKDDEIKKLRAELQKAQSVSKESPKGDIRDSVNRQGDVKKICIGVNSTGQREWKNANELTADDIKAREAYISQIKQLNAKKYQ